MTDILITVASVILVTLVTTTIAVILLMFISWGWWFDWFYIRIILAVCVIFFGVRSTMSDTYY